MGTEANKAVVRRLMHELLAKGNLDVADEVLAPDHSNVVLGGTDASAVKATVTAVNAVLRGQRLRGRGVGGGGRHCDCPLQIHPDLPMGARWRRGPSRITGSSTVGSSTM
jgi:hypothetical protein